MKISILLILIISIPLNLFASPRQDLLTFESKHSVAQTRDNLVQILEKKGFTIFTQIDHAAGAKKVGIDLPDTKIVIFGNPKIGSKLMQCSPTIAIDLPQKALIWQSKDNKVWLSVNSPNFLKERHKVQGCDKFFKKITNALTAISTKATN